MSNLSYSVNLWGSHPDDDNDDCHTGEEFATKAEAQAAYENWRDHFGTDSVLATSHVEIDGPDIHEVKRVGRNRTRARFERDYEWEREQAMEAGMCFGIDAYNEMMGYD